MSATIPPPRDIFAEAREKYSIADVWRAFGYKGEPKGSCKSPFRSDHTPSFSIHHDGTAWTDHATGEGGDVIEFVRHALGGCDHKLVRYWFGERLGIDYHDFFPVRAACKPATVPEPRKVIQWPAELVEGTEETWEAFAKLRGITYPAAWVLVNAGVLRFCRLPDGTKCYVVNYEECVTYGTDPAKDDTDEDGAKDAVDAFPLDPAEALDTDQDGIGDNADTDDDGDGLSDADEISIYGTDPKCADSDGDGLTDRDELQVNHTDPLLADTDNDGLDDGAELARGTNPKAGDSDGDGFLDGYEILTGHSPLAALDKPALVAEARTAIEYAFPAALGKSYQIEGSIDLVTWTIVESGIAGNGAFIQRFYSTRDMPQRYFRVEELTVP